MKKLSLSITLLLIVLLSHGQTDIHWTINPMNVPATQEAKIGTASGDPLFLVTKNRKSVTIDTAGNVKFNKLAGTGVRLLYTDANGNIAARPGLNADNGAFFDPDPPCLANPVPWYLGGNIMIPRAFGVVNNDIGTCNNYDFILKANSKKSLFITAQNAWVGVGLNNSAPSAVLDILDPANNNTQHTLVRGDLSATISSPNAGKLTLNDDQGTGGPGSGVGLSSPSLLSFKSFDTKLECDPNGGLTFTGGAASFITPSYGLFVVNSANFYLDNTGKARFGITGANLSSKLAVAVTGGQTPTNAFEIYDNYSSAVNFRVKSDGSTYARYIKVTVSAIPDYVFNKDYQLPSLKEVENYYKSNHHLSEIPSAKEMEKEGMDLGEMNKLLLKKIEELTLYMVEQNKKTEALQTQLNDLKKNK
jgi:hypothetical protein